ncbi:MAG: cytochrome c oxidase subunit 3 [Bacteroidia bacterium]|nr:cytochrome c oxidase subunit 3 [Bacteroidia bacterium]
MYDLDKPKKLKRSMLLALFFSVLFVFFQFLGWSALLSKGLDLQSSPSVSYLYILTGLHVLHVAVGIVFLLVSVFRSHKNTTDNVKALIFFSDPIKRSRLKLLNNYWHTIDFLWVYLFLAFLFHHA